MSIEKFVVSNDPNIYEAWPDAVLTKSQKIVCVFSECTHHMDRSYTRIMLTESVDRGRTWSRKHPLTEPTYSSSPYYYNCARIARLTDKRLVITVDRIFRQGVKKHKDDDKAGGSRVVMYFSADEGNTWSEAVDTPLVGIVPDKLIELENGRWIISAHQKGANDKLTQYMHYSDDRGQSWSERITVAESDRYNLCEASMLPLGDNKIVAFLRENSFKGYDCFKTISKDNGQTWGELMTLPLPACHRPTAGFLNGNKEFLITYRFRPGGNPYMGARSLFAALCRRDTIFAVSTEEIKRNHIAILPLDYDRSEYADGGYSGWVQFPDSEIFVVNYIMDDAAENCQIRGYSIKQSDFILPKEIKK